MKTIKNLICPSSKRTPQYIQNVLVTFARHDNIVRRGSLVWVFHHKTVVLNHTSSTQYSYEPTTIFPCFPESFYQLLHTQCQVVIIWGSFFLPLFLPVYKCSLVKTRILALCPEQYSLHNLHQYFYINNHESYNKKEETCQKVSPWTPNLNKTFFCKNLWNIGDRVNSKTQ